MSQKPEVTVAAQASGEVMHKPPDSVDVEEETGSGGISTDLVGDPWMASPRLIPVLV